MARGHIDLRREDIVALIDRREQLPADLPGMRTERATLETADYTVKGLERIVAVERKALPDLLQCCGRDRDRFLNCLHRMRAFEAKALVIEATWPEIYAGMWRAHRITPEQVENTLYSWTEFVTVLIPGDRRYAGKAIAQFLESAARRRWEQLRGLRESLKLMPYEEGA